MIKDSPQEKIALLAKLRMMNHEMDKVQTLVLGSIQSQDLPGQFQQMREYLMFGTRTDPMRELQAEAEKMEGMTVADLANLKPVQSVVDEVDRMKAKQNIF